MTHPAIDPRVFRDALGHYASGITVITGRQDAAPVGFTCQSFYSVSLEPPLISFSVKQASNSWPRIRPSGRFAVNMLSADQEALSNGFASSSGDRWSGVDWTESAAGNPLIAGALLQIDCEIFAEHEAGDHRLVIGRVLQLATADPAQDHSPLIYFKGRYRQLHPA
ncbi:flavin reductase family protein [Pseudodonghicola flavimaris]|uniref:Flavin reductase family protein n=1 Tax=Pseudodonghicola flavimaris TaxID=3050036 RepID=A0ABT7F2U7_9RHOB|nr:flavin reductase family protein [Pseudodonghicola flavimaris]MDK3018913.1 flavin reductase family protein [Pseudodonghicola flavimaris]